MTNASAVSESAALYNELLSLDVEDVVRPGQIEWMLQASVVRRPWDVETRVALIEALRVQGKAFASVENAHAAWPLRQDLSGGPLRTFQQQLVGLGLYEWATELLSSVDLDERVRADFVRVIAFNSGDFEAFASSSPRAARVTQALRTAGLDRTFAGHQAIVRRTVSQRQVYVDFRILPTEVDGENWSELSQYFYVGGTYRERSELEWALYRELEAFYDTNGLDAAVSLDLMTPMLMDVRARPLQ